MAGLAGIIGSALGGAVDVLAPVAQQRTIDQLRAEIEAKRQAALMAHQREMQEAQHAFQGEQGDLNRAIEQERVGLIGRQLDQQAGQFYLSHEQRGEQFDRELGQRDAHHKDKMTLEREELELLKQGGGGKATANQSDVKAMVASGFAKDEREAWSIVQNMQARPSEVIAVAKMLQEAQEQQFVDPDDPSYRQPQELLEQAHRLVASGFKMGEGGQGDQSSSSIPTISSREEYDQLEPGAFYIFEGVRYRKGQ